MRIVILTSNTHGVASRVLPALFNNSKLDVAKVVLARGVSPNQRSHRRRKFRKLLKIGALGALNGVRMRRWYADSDTEDIRELCKPLDIELTETPFVNCDATRVAFRQARPQLGLSLGNGYIGKSLFSIPEFGMINIHMEILPDYPGAQSIIWPIYEGRAETGFTIHQISSEIDKGAILFQERYPIQFLPTLRETVEHSLNETRTKLPGAFAHVCEHYHALCEDTRAQESRQSFTTPSIWQYVRMVRNHRAMYDGLPVRRQRATPTQ